MGSIQFKVTTNKSSLRIRSGPAESYQVLGYLEKGTIHSAIAECGDWYKISDGKYCSKKWCTELSRQTDEAPKKEVSTSVVVDTNAVSNSTLNTNTDTVDMTDFNNKIMNMMNMTTTELSSGFDGSVRMLGAPHQLIKHNDYRISDMTNLGRIYTQNFMMEAPIIFIKPGTSNFLPGMSKKEKEAFAELFLNSSSSDSQVKSLMNEIADQYGKENIRWFGFKSRLAKYMSTVNLLCRTGAIFFNLHKKKVPWAKGNVTYGTYDWTYYRFKESEMQNITQTKNTSSNVIDSIGAFMKDCANSIADKAKKLISDDMYIQFYIDPSSGFSESASNSTTQSMLNSYTDSLTSIGKELSFVSGVTGLNIDEVASKSVGTVDSAIQSMLHDKSGSMATFLKRLTGASSQLISGSNFIAPDIWDRSNFSKSYSFSLNLATPYGNEESWFLNCWVPLCFILGLGIPYQTSANTYSAPCLIKAFAPGRASCDLGIVDSISIEKGGSGDSWTYNGLPNELKISVSIVDLYSNLSLPADYSVKDFFSNDSLLNYIMVNCGVDITKPSFDDKISVWLNTFAGGIVDNLTRPAKQTVFNIKESINNLFNLFH